MHAYACLIAYARTHAHHVDGWITIVSQQHATRASVRYQDMQRCSKHSNSNDAGIKNLFASALKITSGFQLTHIFFELLPITTLSHSMSPGIHSAHARVSRPLNLHFIQDRDYISSVKAVASTQILVATQHVRVICPVPIIQLSLTQCR